MDRLSKRRRLWICRSVFAYCAWVGLGLAFQAVDSQAHLAYAQVVQLIIAIGLSYLAGELLKPDPQIVLKDDKPSTTSQRGSYLPLLIGRRRVGALIGWVGSREIRQEVVAEGGSGIGGDDVEQDVYYESAWHQLCIGPCYKLWGIQQNGRQLLTSTITSTTHPSGTTVSLGDEGEFKVFWGEPNQPRNQELKDAEVLNVESRWPYVCYIYWVEKRLGTVPTWQLIEYDIEARPFSPCLINSSPWLESTNEETTLEFSILEVNDGDNGTGWFSVPEDQRHLLSPGQEVTVSGNGPADGNYTIFKVAYDAEVGDASQIFLNESFQNANGFDGTALFTSVIDNEGANGAHILFQVLFETHPHGRGLPKHFFDLNSLEVVGQQVEEEGATFSLIVQNGEQANAAVVQLLQDMGCFISFTNGRYVFKLIRTEDPTRELSADLILDPLPEIEHNFGVLDKDRLLFVFSDRLRNFRDVPIAANNDGRAQLEQNVSARKVPLPTVTDFLSASITANRREQEEFGQRSKFSITSNREARRMFPGQSFKADSVFSGRTLRLGSVHVPDQLSGETKLEAIPDTYGSNQGSLPLDEGGGIPQSLQPPLPDLAFAVIESPEQLNPGSQRLFIPRIRASKDIGRAAIWISRDGRTYTHKGLHTESHTGGTLVESWRMGSPTVERGPAFQVLGVDIDKALDLTEDDHNFYNGRQLGILNGEILFIRRIEMLSIDTFRIVDVLRARYGTPQKTHVKGSTLFLCNSENIRRVGDILLEPETEVWVKTQPMTSIGVSLTDVDPERVFLTGEGRAVGRAEAVADASGWSDPAAESDFNDLLDSLRNARTLKQ